MSTTVQDVLNDLNDLTGEYQTGTATDSIKIRHINKAVEWVKRKIGLPSDEVKQTINWSQDQIFYDLNSDVDELLYIYWKKQSPNTHERYWTNVGNYDEILKRQGDANKRFNFAETHINGSKQVAISGYNITPPSTIDSMDEVGTWEVSGDASALAVDVYTKYAGTGSLSFSVTNSSGVASIIDDSVTLNIDDLIKNNGMIKLRQYLSSANIDDVALYLYTDDSNYWTITETDLDDSTAFTASNWDKVGFPMANRVATGSPTATNITKIRIEYDLGAGFTTGTIKVDDLFLAYPDELELVYKTSIKGTDSTGVVNRTTLKDVTDIVNLGHDDLAELVAHKAALRIWPTLKGDKEFWAAYRQLEKELLGDFARRYPRKRTSGTRETSFNRG